GNASPTIQNNTIYSNVAQSNGGGGIYRKKGFPTIRNNVVVSNTNWGVYGSVTVYYSDIWGNTTGQCGGGASCAAGDGNIEQNPDFVNPGVDFHLQQSSPCIDAADPNNYADTDYDGYARPFGTRADMGAYEFYTGTCFARVGNSQVYTTVQAAVDAAGSGAQVSVGGTCTGVETRAGVTQTVYISQPLTLRGGYTLTNWTSPTTQAILDAQGLGRGVYITGTGGITVDGFILRGGTAITGGGLYVAVPLSPTVQNIIFYSNTADYGGGFASAGGSPRLYNDTFVTNTATYSGGAAYFDAGFPVVSNTIVVSNAAPSGGGLFATANATPTLAYNDVWQNTGGNYAGNVTTGTTDFSADPLFVDFAAADFHLRADSPGIHTGDPGTTLETDFEGDTRPLGRGYDVGADESTTYPDVIFAPPLWSSGIPGQSVVYNHTLTNSGSISDTFDLTHTLAISGPGTGWSVGYTSVFTLPAGGMAAVPVTVSVPADAISGTQAVVVLTATSRANIRILDTIVNTTTIHNTVDPFLSTLLVRPSGLVANGISSAVVTVTLRNAAGHPVSDTHVYLRVVVGTANIIGGSPVPDYQSVFVGLSGLDGVVTTTLATTKAETKTISALGGGVWLGQQAQVTFVAGPPDAGLSRVWAGPAQVVADGVATATVHVLVYDAYRNPVPGATVMLSDTGSGTVLTQPAQPTGADGRTWGAIRSTAIEVVTVTATADGVLLDDTAQVTFVGADLRVAKEGPGTALIGTPVTYTLTIVNEDELTAEGIVVTDTLPEGMSFVTHTASFPFTSPSQGGAGGG
nr:DUF11 domain-containing protein [Anaerolineae bacterium]